MNAFDRKLSILVISLVTLVSTACTEAVIIGAIAAKSAGEGAGKAIGQGIAQGMTQMLTPKVGCAKGFDSQQGCATKVNEKAYWTNNTPFNKIAGTYTSYEFTPTEHEKELGRVRIAHWRTNARGALGEVEVGVIEQIATNSFTYRLVNSSCRSKRTALNKKEIVGYERLDKILKVWQPQKVDKIVYLSRVQRTLESENVAWGCL